MRALLIAAALLWPASAFASEVLDIRELQVGKFYQGIESIDDDIQLTTRTAAGPLGLVFSDGSRQTTAATSAAAPNISTTAPNGTTTATACGPCIASSTVTLTVSANSRSLLWYSGTVANNADTRLVVLTMLQNGAFVGNDTSSQGTHGGRNSSANSPFDVSFQYQTGQLSAGTYNWCISICVPSGTGKIPADEVDGPSVNRIGQFGAWELK